MRIEVVALEHHGRLAGDGAVVHALGCDLDVIDHDTARRGSLEPVHTTYEHRLARTRWTDDDDLLARLDPEVYALESLDLLEVLLDVLHEDHVVRLPSCIRRRERVHGLSRLRAETWNRYRTSIAELVPPPSLWCNEVTVRARL